MIASYSSVGILRFLWEQSDQTHCRPVIWRCYYVLFTWLTWRANGPVLVFCCGCLEAKRSFDVFFVNHCIKMKWCRLFIFRFFFISVLRSRSSHPLKPIRIGAPSFGLGYAVGLSWPFNWICCWNDECKNASCSWGTGSPDAMLSFTRPLNFILGKYQFPKYTQVSLSWMPCFGSTGRLKCSFFSLVIHLH